MCRILAGLLAMLGLVAYGAITVAVICMAVSWCTIRLLAFCLAMLIFASGPA